MWTPTGTRTEMEPFVQEEWGTIRCRRRFSTKYGVGVTVEVPGQALRGTFKVGSLEDVLLRGIG